MPRPSMKSMPLWPSFSFHTVAYSKTPFYLLRPLQYPKPAGAVTRFNRTTLAVFIASELKKGSADHEIEVLNPTANQTLQFRHLTQCIDPKRPSTLSNILTPMKQYWLRALPFACLRAESPAEPSSLQNPYPTPLIPKARTAAPLHP